MSDADRAGYTCRMMTRLLLILIVLTATGSVAAQPAEPLLNHPRQVFIERGDPNADAPDTLIFLDLITGETARVNVPDGERYTPLRDRVLYYDRAARRMRLAAPDGTIRDHALMQPPETARRIDWITSADQRRLAWTITDGTADALTTRTYLLEADDDAPRLLFSDAPQDGIRAYPVAFSADGQRVYMDYQPDTIAGLLPLRLYAALFSVEIATGSTRSLPGEAGCFCGAAIMGDQFVRLTIAAGSGFSVRVIDLAALTQRIAPPLTDADPALAAFAQAGDLLIAPDGGQAVYTLLRVHGAAAPNRALERAIALIDLDDLTQRVIVPPTFEPWQVTGWTNDGAALRLTAADRAGTWLLDLRDPAAAPRQTAAATWIGTLTPLGTE